MTETSPRLVTWENGTDLVIELPVARDIETVWNALTDSGSAGAWFAPFRLGEGDDSGDDSADDSTDEPSALPITFELEDADLNGSVLSCEEYDHVLLELEAFGVVGVRLVPAGGEAADAGEETLLVFTHTAADVDSARAQAADFGPMWDTHLRLFARSLGLDVAEATEPELDAAYADLDVETADSAGGFPSVIAGDDA
ncbi:hypothetical protein [Brevibacterium spongiae]|uniref:ATPase n=1 Tax=Brevibacterium spongiae TaxID=2909672 RepID=A0ABY5SKR9_9MICO|nr:hypothetical protein [Brevibacterium spongiae]UVI35132.1 hypothetical protein L1F31_13540 [Brevibacterium spongiae]